MEIFCLCCLTETTHAYKITMRCEFRKDECYGAIEILELGELYKQLTQLPPTIEIPTWANEPICDHICARCVGVLKDFYLFRMKALKTREELQTKANIVKIINNLDRCIESSGIALAEHSGEDDEQAVTDNSIDDAMCGFNNGKGKFECLTCFKKFMTHKLLERHEESHSTKRNYRCQYCKMTFAAKASCYNHELRMHRNPIERSEGTLTPRRINSVSSIHMRKHTGTQKTKSRKGSGSVTEQKLFQCNLCTKHFTRKSSLNAHRLVLHAGVKKHFCKICHRTFGKGDSLKTHMALHTGKIFQCKVCSKSFAKTSFLRKHLREHEIPESNRKYTCAVCAKKFIALSHLNDHELIHSDKRPHKCDHCGKTFRQKQQLKVHTYQHIGKPFRCTYCNLTYALRSRLLSHMNKHHVNDEQECTNKTNFAVAIETGNPLQPDFGDKAVNEDILNEICCQINSNPIILENIEAGGVNLICNENIVFLSE